MKKPAKSMKMSSDKPMKGESKKMPEKMTKSNKPMKMSSGMKKKAC